MKAEDSLHFMQMGSQTPTRRRWRKFGRHLAVGCSTYGNLGGDSPRLYRVNRVGRQACLTLPAGPWRHAIKPPWVLARLASRSCVGYHFKPMDPDAKHLPYARRRTLLSRSAPNRLQAPYL